jgi:DHA1 family multidrug resistance protein-like MFS transporter
MSTPTLTSNFNSPQLDCESDTENSHSSRKSTSGTRHTEDPTAVNAQSKEKESPAAGKPCQLPPPADPDLVAWDGPNDPENPQNWSFKKKVSLTALVIVLTVNV